MGGLVPLSAALVASIALSGCGKGVPPTSVEAPSPISMGEEVPGRHLQAPWWSALPEPIPRSAATGHPTVSPLEIPADTLFDSGSTHIGPRDAARLRTFATGLRSTLEANTGEWIVVGATDSTGAATSNAVLGQRRAEAVIEVLRTVPGVDAHRFRAGSWGEACPAVNEANTADLAQARAQNRRVVLLPPDVDPPCPILTEPNH